MFLGGFFRLGMQWMISGLDGVCRGKRYNIYIHNNHKANILLKKVDLFDEALVF